MQNDFSVPPASDSEAARLWTSCSQSIRSQLSDAVWKTTFRDAKPASLHENCLVLTVPTAWVKTRIERRFGRLVTEALDEASPGVTVRIQLEASSADSAHAPLPPEEPPSAAAQERRSAGTNNTFGSSRRPGDRPYPGRASLARSPAAGVASPPGAASPGPASDRPWTDATPPPSAAPDRLSAAASSPVNPKSATSRLTFSHFVTGTSNRFAYAAALAVAERPANEYNPLFIYGASGLGKTHLLCSIAHYVHCHYPEDRVRYVTSETFLNEFIKSIRTGTQHEFKQHYRTYSVLLVDDIQFLKDKDGLQEEFFHTFNDVYHNGGQIVLSSDRLPDAIPTLEGRLRSRFRSGLMTDIQPPDIETRLAILQKKNELRSLRISDAVLMFIAENITDSIRELEGALIKVSAYSNLNKKRCSSAEAKQLLANHISHSSMAPVTIELILSLAVEMFAVTNEQIIGPSRRRPLVHARQVAMYAARTMTELSYPEIGRAFGKRDHTTVMYAFRKIENQMKDDKELLNQVQELQRRVNAAR